MSHFLDRLTFFNRETDEFACGHGITTREDRSWEDGYRKRWQHDKIVRSTHGANCTGSCSWKISLIALKRQGLLGRRGDIRGPHVPEEAEIVRGPWRHALLSSGT